MKGLVKVSWLSLVAILAMAVPAMAQTGGGTTFSGAFGAGLTTLGAALGIGKLASAALEGMARQPEGASNIQTAMIIIGALLEGLAFGALILGA